MNKTVNIDGINIIIKTTISQIETSKNQIFNIITNLRSEHDRIQMELIHVQSLIEKVIDEVDMLETVDKKMRSNLAIVSKNFKNNSEFEMKRAYEEAAFTRAELMSKQKEESLLRDRRDTLERRIKDSLENIESAEKIVNQVSVALGYLEGDVLEMIDDSNSSISSGISILEAQENERRRIARDIHDGPAQHMASVVMRMDFCKMLMKKDLDEGLRELDYLKNSVKTSLKEVRSILFDLRPVSFEEVSLNQSIEDMVKSILQGEETVPIFKLKEGEVPIEPMIQVATYRLVQEIMNNVKKHSKAKTVKIDLSSGQKYINLIIEDDGIGFNMKEVLKDVKVKGTSYGLIGIVDRVKGLLGEVNILSNEGVGTAYKIKLPINREVLKDEKNKVINSR